MLIRRHLLAGAAAGAIFVNATAGSVRAQSANAIAITTPVSPPEWALLQRELLLAEADACEAFYARYFDERGYFQCFERWGADDGPDDAIENCNNWPHLHMLGAPDRVMALYTQAWEGHLKQYTAAKTIETEIAREGMYYREFPVMNDWQHTSEFLSVFNVMGLSDSKNSKFQERARRYSSFYIGEDTEAANYDTKHKLIKSLISGSKGPMLRPATELDWAGDPFDPRGFFMEHGETSFDEMRAHFKEYGDVVGDNPLNMQAVSLVFNAYMIAGEPKYRDWIETYLGAWMERARKNGGVLPSHVDLDGRIGGKTKAWYGSVYGWGFSPVVPQTGKREDRNRVPRAIVAFMNAYLMTGDDRYLQVWRTQTDVINAQAKIIDGVVQAPTMYGKDGWYSYKPGLCQTNGLEIWYMSMRDDDFKRANTDHPWIDYLRGNNPTYPVKAQREALEIVRTRMDYLLNKDKTTPQTRLADTLLNYNTAPVTQLLHLMCGAIHIARPPWSKTSPAQGGALLYARLRYFDPIKKRAGIPHGVAALVSELTDTTTTLTLVNTDTIKPRTVTIQAGGYGEHQFAGLDMDGHMQVLDANHVTVDLAAGSGATITFTMRRHVNRPTLAMPWDV